MRWPSTTSLPARVELSAARKADRCRDQVGDRINAPLGVPRVTNVEEGEPRIADRRGNKRKEYQ